MSGEEVKSKYKSDKSLLQKVLPYSEEAERSLLGGLLLDNKSWDKISSLVCEDDFYQLANRHLFSIIAKLSNESKSIDVVTLSDCLLQKNLLSEIGGESYLYELMNNTPSAANVSFYAEIIRDKAIVRRLLAAGKEIIEASYQPDGRAPRELIDFAERQVFSIADARQLSSSGPEKIDKVLARTTERIDHLYHSGTGITGVSTGFTDLDKMTSGLQPGDLVIIAGRPSMGKTVLGLNIAENVAIAEKKPVLFFSLEMPSDMLAMRLLSSLGRVGLQKISTGNLSDEDWPRVTSAVGMLSDAPFLFDDSASLTPSELRSTARRVLREYKELGLIVVDYLQLMRAPDVKENRTMEISEISRNLKLVAKEMKVPVIALSQLNRGLESRQDKRPIMSDLRESGAIEQDADLIAFIYRDEVYNPETERKGVAEIIIGKQRNGPIGKINLTFLGEFTKFENYSGADDEYME